MFKLKIFKNKKELLFFFLLFIISIISTGIVYAFKFNGPPIRSDGLGYYAYLPSLFIYNDITMNKFVDAYSTHYGDPKSDSWNGSYKYENTDKFLNKYPLGVAVMALPFFVVAHIGTLIISQFSGVPPDGFTDPLYHAAHAFSGLFYGILGLLVLKRILDKYFSSKVVYITLILIVFGTNLFHYFTYDAVFSHAYSFFLFAAFLFLTIKWYKNAATSTSILLGLTTGLIITVRPVNALIIIFFLFFGISISNFKTEFKNRTLMFLKNYKKIFLIVFCALIVFSLQLLYYYLITGKLYVFAYKNEYFDFSNPQILNVLFSIRKGLFFWAPVLLFALPGFYLIRKNFKGFTFAAILFLSINLYIVSSWWSWSYGGGFGMRALIETFPVIAILLAATIEEILNKKSKKLRLVFITLIAVCVIFTTYMMIQYWRGFIPVDGTNFQSLLNGLLNKEKLPVNL